MCNDTLKFANVIIKDESEEVIPVNLMIQVYFSTLRTIPYLGTLQLKSVGTFFLYYPFYGMYILLHKENTFVYGRRTFVRGLKQNFFSLNKSVFKLIKMRALKNV